jgi:hypothetical protein
MNNLRSPTIQTFHQEQSTYINHSIASYGLSRRQTDAAPKNFRFELSRTRSTCHCCVVAIDSPSFFLLPVVVRRAAISGIVYHFWFYPLQHSKCPSEGGWRLRPHNFILPVHCRYLFVDFKIFLLAI